MGIQATAEDLDSAGMEVQADTQATAPHLDIQDIAPLAGSADTVVGHLDILGSARSVDIQGSAQRATAGTQGSVAYLVTAVFRDFLATADFAEQLEIQDSADTQVILRLIQVTADILVRAGTRGTQPPLQGRLDTAGILALYREQAGSPDSAVNQGIRASVVYPDILGSRVKVDTVGTPEVGSVDTLDSAAGAGTADSRQSRDIPELQDAADSLGTQVFQPVVDFLDTAGTAVHQGSLGFQQQIRGHLDTPVIQDIQEQQDQ